MSQTTYRLKMCSVCVWCFYIACLLILFVSTKENVEASQLSSPSKEFSRHRIVQPSVHHARTKREISTTRDKTGAHHSDVTVRVQIDGEEYVLDLRLNQDLITDGHTIQYQKNGKTVRHKPKKEEIEVCQYSGTVRDKPGSWVAVSTCRGVRGVIFDGQKMRYIQPVEANDIQAAHYLYDHSDLTAHHRCGYEGGVTKNESYDPLLHKKYTDQQSAQRSRIARYKREAEETLVRGPYNENKLTRYVELVLVSDYREYRSNGESLETVHHQLKDVANIINSVYAPLNIFIALVGVVVWNERDEIHLVENGDDTLENFLQYRRQTLLADIPNDNAHLITGQKFSEGVVGKALKGPICTFQYSGGVATNHSEVIGLVATTIAHEMGHNFGMEHDTEQDCTCPDDKCIMSPSSTSVTPVHWSSCSLKSLALAFEKGMDYCLRNKPKRLFDSPTCGNGFVELGEQCDCGIAIDKAPNPCHGCCDPATCMLRRNATCAAGTCCDLKSCRPKGAGTVCRGADRECDLPEYCTGYSEYCPEDVHKMDATPCNDGQAYCVRGSCRSHTDQCRLLWGITGESSHDKCYTTNNVKGTKNGNCGYSRLKQMYKVCRSEDAPCGLLHCRHLNERLEFGMESAAQISAVFINDNGTIIPCRTAIIDFGLSDVDPGMVPDGAKCGPNKMCMNQRCVRVESVQAAIAHHKSSDCPSNCSGHGVCNSEGHCHCSPGFAPPLCALPGPGGSYESGPATDPTVQRTFMVTMYIIFLGIIPAILLILLLCYYSRHNVLYWWQKPKKSYVQNLVCNARSIIQKPNLHLSSFRHKIPFKTQPSNSQIELHTDPNKESSTLYKKLANLRSNQKFKPLKRLDRKIEKDDIKITSDTEKSLKPKNASDSEKSLKPKNASDSEKSLKAKNASDTEKSLKPEIASDTEKSLKPKIALKPTLSQSTKNKPYDTHNNSQIELNVEYSNDRKTKTTHSYHKFLIKTPKYPKTKSLKKLSKKINKDDIKIACDTDHTSLSKPEIAEKPNTKPEPKQIKPSISIVTAGLASTTNEMVAHPRRSRLLSIKRDSSIESKK